MLSPKKKYQEFSLVVFLENPMGPQLLKRLFGCVWKLSLTDDEKN